MQHQGRAADLWTERTIIHFSPMGPQQLGGVRGRGCLPHQIVETASLFGRRFRHQLRCVKLSECGILISPTKLDQLELGLGLFNLLRDRITCQPPACSARMQDEMSHSFRVTDSIVDCDGASRPQAQQSEPVTLCCFDNGLQVLDLP
jgi:hypothetical protein